MDFAVDVRIQLDGEGVRLEIIGRLATTEDSSVGCHIGVIPILIGYLLGCDIGSILRRYAHKVVLTLALCILGVELGDKSLVVALDTEVGIRLVGGYRVVALVAILGLGSPHLNDTDAMATTRRNIERDIRQVVDVVVQRALGRNVVGVDIEDTVEPIDVKSVFVLGKLLIKVFS